MEYSSLEINNVRPATLDEKYQALDGLMVDALFTLIPYLYNAAAKSLARSLMMNRVVLKGWYDALKKGGAL